MKNENEEKKSLDRNFLDWIELDWIRFCLSCRLFQAKSLREMMAAAATIQQWYRRRKEMYYATIRVIARYQLALKVGTLQLYLSTIPLNLPPRLLSSSRPMLFYKKVK